MENKLKNEITIIEKQAKSLIVNTEHEYIAVSEYIKAAKMLQKKVSELLDPNIKNLHAAHKAATAQKKDLLQPLINAEKQAGMLVAAYLYRKEQQRKDIEKQEQERLEAEAKKNADLLNRLGFQDEAKMALQEPVLQPVKIKSDVEKTGVSLRTDFDFEIINELEIKREFLIPDMSKIRQLVKNLKHNAVSIVGGIKVIEKLGTTTRIKKEY